VAVAQPNLEEAVAMDIEATGRTPSAPIPPLRRRAAAALALAALIAAVVVAAVALVQDPGRLLLASILVAAAVIAGWTALVNRGGRRLAATALAGLALAGMVVLLIGSVLQLAIALGLVLLSTAAARVALGHDLAHAPGGARSVGQARRGVLLMNPWSGGGKVERFALEFEARRRGIRPVVLRRGDDLRTLAEQAVADGADVIGMAGGDGSQAVVADVARQHDLPFVCVPAGTRNHFALDLGLDRDDVAAALDAYGTAVERRIDLALLGDRVFVNNASLGVYATVVQSDAYRNAKLATTTQLLPGLLGPDAQRFDLRFTGPDGVDAPSADVVLVSNGVYRLERLNGFGTRQRMDAGVLGVVTVSVDRARDLPALISAEATGRIAHFRGYRAWTTPAFEVRSGSDLIDVGVDGEALALPPPLVFRSLPGALRVRTPVDAPGASPAAMAPPGIGSAVTALLRVLAGHPAR
jgi:diacylglycerol kinase family enzyme